MDVGRREEIFRKTTGRSRFKTARTTRETMRKPGKIALATPENFTVLISTPVFPSPPLRIVHDSNDRGGLITKHIDLFVALLFALACCIPSCFLLTMFWPYAVSVFIFILLN